MTSITIKPFDNFSHRDPVIALWEAVFGCETAHNSPSLVIDKKIAIDDGLFFVAVDGHRGWIYSVAVHPNYRKQGIGSGLVAHAERALGQKGCMKINLQIMQGNEAVTGFYASLGYVEEQRVSMGKRIDENIPVVSPYG
jgi:ribosomal protein S18 acetylase RimI-like enzyme